MAIIGIVCEYNPFHLGHLAHIQSTKQALGEDSTIVCVMSGDYVQRGEPALYNKFARAEAACKCGADLVVELPLPWCLASAEGFARGAVGLLGSLGAEYISFGSECGDVKRLDGLAKLLLDPKLIYEIKQLMALQGELSYARARQSVLESHIGQEAGLIESPNNILGVEYIKAIYELGLNIRPFTVKRIGNAHDSMGDGSIKSASELRMLLRQCKSIEAYIPKEAAAVYRREREQGRAPDMNRFETALMSRLRLLDRDSCNLLPDSGEGLGNRFWKAATEEASLDAVLAASKSKRYAMARMRRMCMCAALNISGELGQGVPGYARVLASNSKGFAVLHKCGKNDCIKVISKPAAARELSAGERNIFELGAAAHDLYSLSYPAICERKGGSDWRNSPFVVDNDQKLPKNKK